MKQANASGKPKQALLSPGFAVSLFVLYATEDVGDLFLRNEGLYPNLRTFQARRPYF
jgi:hypothetical protein